MKMRGRLTESGRAARSEMEKLRRAKKGGRTRRKEYFNTKCE